jgi:hypothetical protein
MLETTTETAKSLELAARHINSPEFLLRWNVDYVWYIQAAGQKANVNVQSMIQNVMNLTEAQREQRAFILFAQQGIRFIHYKGEVKEIFQPSDLKINW